MTDMERTGHNISGLRGERKHMPVRSRRKEWGGLQRREASVSVILCVMLVTGVYWLAGCATSYPLQLVIDAPETSDLRYEKEDFEKMQTGPRVSIASAVSAWACAQARLADWVETAPRMGVYSASREDWHRVCSELTSFRDYFRRKSLDLLREGADLASTNVAGQTALHWSLFDPDLTQLLLEHGAPVNAQDRNGNTPLHFAFSGSWDMSAKIIERRFACARLLLRAGANPNLARRDGKKPFDRIEPQLLHIADLILDFRSEEMRRGDFGGTSRQATNEVRDMPPISTTAE